ncbi:hypothetical protein VSQ32_12685 [Lachnospiraceae bacterium KK002]
MKAAEKMNCYPESGYISVQDGFVVVKLSEAKEKNQKQTEKSR